MVELPAYLASALADRYRIERELGQGGMATVYLAEDLKHHRKVAIKVLKPELAAAVGAERFLREIETTASLRHPHILPLYDSGTVGQEDSGKEPPGAGPSRRPTIASFHFLYYVMPYVEGESLRERLDRERQLPLEEALQIAREVADALSYAHGRGIVHRDIKPENILLESGHAVVADFGIARAVSAAGGESITQTGMAIGTPQYMSPEQATGEKDIDGRSDLYSLGCVLYEMLAGQPPFTGPSVESVVYQHLTAQPLPITQIRPAVPAEVAAILQRALAKTPADRWNPAAQFAEALRSPGGRASAAVTAPPGEQTIAVLPFLTMPADPENEYFSDGITEEIINALVQVPGLQVSSRSSSFAFKGKNLPMTEVAARLQVATVLEGSVRKAGTRLRITAQLIDVRTDTHLWSERFDRQMDDVFAIQDEIAAAIVGRFEGSPGPSGGPPLVRPPTANLDAYHMYLKGRQKWHLRGPHMFEALEWFQRAAEADPDFAQAHAGVSDALSLLGLWGYVGSAAVKARAKPAAERALALDPALPDGHLAMGLYELYQGWNLREAESRFRHAAESRPGTGVDLAWLAQMIGMQGRSDEALTLARQAMAREPYSAMVCMITCPAFLGAGRHAELLDVAARSLALEENYSAALWARSWALVALGQHAEAITNLERAADQARRSPMILPGLATAYHEAGKTAEARAVIEELGRLPQVSPAYRVWALLGSGERDAGLALLPSVLDDHGMVLWGMPCWPELRWLLQEPRWTVFMESAGLADVLASQRKGFAPVA